MPYNPLVANGKLSEEIDVRHKRRAISPQVVQQLVQTARESGRSIQCFDGEQRARIYIIAYMTGLRRKELGKLTKRSFDLKSNPAIVTVEAEASKHRKKDELPLHPYLVGMLKEWLAGINPERQVVSWIGKEEHLVHGQERP